MIGHESMCKMLPRIWRWPFILQSVYWNWRNLSRECRNRQNWWRLSGVSRGVGHYEAVGIWLMTKQKADSAMLFDATEYAARAHREDYRKGHGSPCRPSHKRSQDFHRVLLCRGGHRWGLLHDTVEETSAGQAMIGCWTWLPRVMTIRITICNLA